MVMGRWEQRRWPAVQRELERIIQRLRPLDPEKIVLFGSFARGDFHENSDIDLIIILDTQRRPIDRIGEVLSLIDAEEFDVEPHVYTPPEYESLKHQGALLIEAAEREGKVLYERHRRSEPV